ncbi:hypothetical protein SK128_020697, partial [Halocaridina rubra]
MRTEYGKPDSLLGLANFMLESTMGQHYYLLYDNTTISAGVTDGLVRLLKSRGDVAVFQYDEKLIQLEKAIRGFYHVANLRNVFVFCSPQNTINIFKT